MVTAEREAVLDAVVGLVVSVGVDRVLVAVDVRSGAGKSTFADELAVRVEARGGRQVPRSTTDAFHRLRSERVRRGPTSGEGYYLELLEPFARGAARVCVAGFDEPSDSPVHESEDVERSAVLVFDGLFLQRPESERFWDLAVFLDADDRVDDRWVTFLLSDLPESASPRAAAIDERLRRARWSRYRAGWERYVDACELLADTAHNAIVLLREHDDSPRPRTRRTINAEELAEAAEARARRIQRGEYEPVRRLRAEVHRLERHRLTDMYASIVGPLR